MEKNNPRILRNTVHGTEFIDLEEHFMAERKLFLLGDVTPESATGLIKQVMYLLCCCTRVNIGESVFCTSRRHL